ncbi:hypothetical protein L2E82_04310 [Cichorium intybus]|uniref:Uncharacterized protein n=1 Tax=Cichorium intybus TaxID=13427 RepID=A0ACB9H5V6_CICIN|nr:hypothetical protein L2E82_04310 [Cichorium intybus]
MRRNKNLNQLLENNDSKQLRSSAQAQGAVRPGSGRGAPRRSAPDSWRSAPPSRGRQGTSDSLTFVRLVRFSSNLDHRLVMVWDEMVVVHAKARNNRDINAANIEISRESMIDKNGAATAGSSREPYLIVKKLLIDGAATCGYDVPMRPCWLCLRCGLRAMILLQVSMILIGDKIESVTLKWDS